MSSLSSRQLRALFYSLWLLSLFAQAYFVELQGDEAYYWRYGQQLAWGYFDHPPITALLAKMGYLIFQNELGVRLFFILAGAGTIWVIERMIRPTDLKLFYAIVVSVAFLQVGMVFGGGMYAIPDFPLLFFTALFFFFYERYLHQPSAIHIVALAGVISLLMLSKYHGVLVVGFTVLANLSLLKKKSFWFVVVLSIAGLIPHINWQVLHDFPSMKYHLFERSAKGYSFAYTYEYLLSQPFVLGPFVSLLLIYAGFVFKPKNELERSMKVLIIGTYAFFLVMTFKGSVEGNWTVIALVPLLYLGYQHIRENERLKRLTWYACWVSVPLILVVRVAISSSQVIPENLRSKFFGARRWTTELTARAGERPAVFMNSYQRAAQYEFYTGIPSTSLNNVWGRKNQYTTWDNESDMQGKNVVIIANSSMPPNDSIKFLKEYLPYVFIDNFRSTSNVSISSDLKGPVKTKPGDSLRVTIQVKFRNEKVRELEANTEYLSQLTYSFFQNTEVKEMRHAGLQITNLMVGDEGHLITIIAPSQPGTYDFYLSITTGWLPPGINSEKVKFIVE